MCGRFLLAMDPADLQDAFPIFRFPNQIDKRYNIAPSQPVLAVPNVSSLQSDYFVWGLIPSWSKDPTFGSRMINARAETLSEKPTFRGPYKYHRCLIFASGFYEWQQKPGEKTKIPFYFHLKNEKPFAFAGLWDDWHSPDGSQVKSCTIITTNPNKLVGAVHNRMPVILCQGDYMDWLDPSPRSPSSLQNLLIPYPDEEMVASPITSYVNNPANIGPECIHEINS